MQLLASDDEREEMCLRLQEACAEGRLTLEELSERVRQAQLARTRGDLDELARDLPVTTGPAHVPHGLTPVTSITAILSSADRTGPWRIGEVCVVRVAAGSCKLDLRKAAISGRMTRIDARVIAGSLEVILPEGVTVDVDMSAIASSKSMRLKGPPAPSEAPVIRITGTLVAASLAVRDGPRLGERLREAMTRMLGDRGEEGR